MRLKLGLLYDSAALERQAARDAKDAAKEAGKSEATDGKSSDGDGKEKEKKKSSAAKFIRPLSDAKAIDTGANFISEAFLFMVAGGLIVFESWRSRRKEANRREGVEDRLGVLQEKVGELEGEVIRAREEEERLRLLLEAAQEQERRTKRTLAVGNVVAEKETRESSNVAAEVSRDQQEGDDKTHASDSTESTANHDP